MKAAIASKIAMCVCPTAVIATAVTAIPHVRHAVHHATRPHAAEHVRHHNARHQNAASLPCPPAYGGPSPVLFSLPLAIDPILPAIGELLGQTSGGYATDQSLGSGGGGVYLGGGGSGGGGGSVGGGGGGSSGGSTDGGSSGGTGGGTVAAAALREPGSWLLMVGGFAIAGGSLRRRRSLAAPIVAGGFAFAGAMPLRAKYMGLANLAAPEAAGVAASVKTAALAQLAMCVCPPAMIASLVAGVPAAKHAIYNATAPKVVAAPSPAFVRPCDPMMAMIVASDAKPAAALRNVESAVRTN